MAEAPAAGLEENLAIEKIDQELTCSICLNHFEDPKVLPCCHYYCRGCIVKLRARVKSGNAFNCPECRNETVLPGDTTDSLPPAFFINRMKELYTLMQKAQGRVEVRCESCSRASSPAKAFCRDCGYFICGRCEEAHVTMRDYSEHVVVSLNDLRQNTVAHAPTKKAAFKCKEHTAKKVKLYCYDCEQLICKDCIIIDHAGHRYDFVKKAAAECKMTLAKSVAPVREIHADLNQAVEKLESIEEQVSERGRSVSEAIDASADKFMLAIKKRQKELQSEARRLTEKQLADLAVQKKNAQLATVEAESLIEFVDRNSRGDDDQDVLAMKKQLVNQSKEVVKRYKNPKKQFQPAKEVEVKFSCSEDLPKFLKEKMVVKETAKEVTKPISTYGLKDVYPAEEMLPDFEAPPGEEIEDEGFCFSEVYLPKEEQPLEASVFYGGSEKQPPEASEEPQETTSVFCEGSEFETPLHFPEMAETMSEREPDIPWRASERYARGQPSVSRASYPEEQPRETSAYIPRKPSECYAPAPPLGSRTSYPVEPHQEVLAYIPRKPSERYAPAPPLGSRTSYPVEPHQEVLSDIPWRASERYAQAPPLGSRASYPVEPHQEVLLPSSVSRASYPGRKGGKKRQK